MTALGFYAIVLAVVTFLAGMRLNQDEDKGYIVGWFSCLLFVVITMGLALLI